MILKYGDTTYNFPEPEVFEYLGDGIKVVFIDGRSLICDDVSGYGGDTCVHWGGDHYGSMVGPEEGVFTRDDYIIYCKNLWKDSVESRLDKFYHNLEFFGQYEI